MINLQLNFQPNLFNWFSRSILGQIESGATCVRALSVPINYFLMELSARIITVTMLGKFVFPHRDVDDYKGNCNNFH